MQPWQELLIQRKSSQFEWSWLPSELTSSSGKALIGPPQSKTSPTLYSGTHSTIASSCYPSI